MPGAWEPTLTLVAWILAALAVQFLLVLSAGVLLQRRQARANLHRIDCMKRWEEAIIDYFYGSGRTTAFQGLPAKERPLFVTFLLRLLAAVAGPEGEAVRALYLDLDLAANLDQRLVSRNTNRRALAAMEVGSFKLAEHYPALVRLLKDPSAHVAHAAAKGLAGSGDLAYAKDVLTWVVTQEVYQRDRLLSILDGFGAEFLPWLENCLEEQDSPDSTEALIFALLAASSRNLEDTACLQRLLRHGSMEIQAAALKALGAIGNPDALGTVLPFAGHPSWALRAQAAKAIGALAGVAGLGILLDLMADRVYEVRRNASQALADAGPAGIQALEFLLTYPEGDPFARDLARERLQAINPDRDE